jgi:hypothetical protein
VRSLRAEISDNGEQRGKQLRPPGTWSDTFSFVIRDEDNEHARLELPQPGSGDPTYTAKRNGSGVVRLWTPAGGEHDITVGSAGEQLQNGLRVAFRDTRKRGSGWSIPFLPDPSKKKSTGARLPSAAYPPVTPAVDDWGMAPAGSPAPASQVPTQPAPQVPASQVPTQPAPQVPTPPAAEDEDWI